MIYCWVPSDSSPEKSRPPPLIVRGLLETRTSKFWRSFSPRTSKFWRSIFLLAPETSITLEALQRIHMSPMAAGHFGFHHANHEMGMMRAGLSPHGSPMRHSLSHSPVHSVHGDMMRHHSTEERKSPLQPTLIMQVDTAIP